MTVKTVNIIAFLVLLVHGIGHIQGVVSGFGIKFNRKASVTSCLLKDPGSKLNKWICLLLYLGSVIFGILAALAMFFNKVGAIAVNLITFYSILLKNQWTADIF